MLLNPMTISQRILLGSGNFNDQGFTVKIVINAAIVFDITSAGDVKYGLVINSPRTIDAKQE